MSKIQTKQVCTLSAHKVPIPHHITFVKNVCAQHFSTVNLRTKSQISRLRTLIENHSLGIQGIYLNTVSRK